MGVFRLCVGLLEGIRDVRGISLKKQIKRDLGLELDEVRLIKVYTIVGVSKKRD